MLIYDYVEEIIKIIGNMLTEGTGRDKIFRLACSLYIRDK